MPALLAICAKGTRKNFEKKDEIPKDTVGYYYNEPPGRSPCAMIVADSGSKRSPDVMPDSNG
jgi:hypothetical protein